MQLKQDTLLQGGKYRIEKVLGQGGFGITYLGVQVGLNRRVAIKEFFMKECCEREGDTSHMTIPTVNNRELVERFRQKFIKEAQTIAALNHSYIIRIHDIFEENGTAYYVMEYHGGGSLADIVKRQGSLSESEALRYIRQVAEALAYIHERNMNHLDVKPGNVLLDENKNVVLIDFGLSKRYDDAGHQTSTTPVGISHGYAPMEQYKRGGVGTFSPATDIYSLGATLYKLLTGQTPPEAIDVNDEGLPPLPSHVSPSTVRAIERAMQSARKNRPQSIREFLALLDGKAVVDDDDEETTVVTPKSEPKSQPKSQSTPEPKAEPKVVPVVEQKRSSSSKKKLFWIYFIAFASVLFLYNFWIKGGDEKTTASISSPTGSINGHEWVDLGLSVKWATCNVGANSPSGYGNYYAWGETTTKSDYSSSNSVTYEKSMSDIRGNRQYDAARANWGGSWRLPTKTEMEELKNGCTWTWTTQGGHNGYRVTSKKNGRSIFLPAAGWRNGTSLILAGEYGNYWTSTPYESSTQGACGLNFNSSNQNVYWGSRYRGHSVRPVSD